MLDLITVIGLMAMQNGIKFLRLGFRKLIILLSIGIIGIWVWMNYSNRLQSMGVSDRFELLSQAVSEVFSNSLFLFWGHGAKHSYAHNFLLDFILNYGVFFLVIYLGIMASSLFFICKNTKIEGGGARYILLVMAVIGNNSFFNSALTQPIFIINAFIVMQFIISPHSKIFKLKSSNDHSAKAIIGKVT